jgi:hypothetical protein
MLTIVKLIQTESKMAVARGQRAGVGGKTGNYSSMSTVSIL